MNKKPLITLYTPGNKPELIEKASRFEPDGIIIDFEDAVPLNMKSEVRENISKNVIPNLSITALVRVNSEKEFLEHDVRAVTQKNIYGIALPMAESVSQVKFVDEIISDEEAKKGLEKNSIKLLLLIETALGVIKCFDICRAAERVESIVFGSAQDGDLQRDLRSDWSIDGFELNYSRSRSLVEARAAKMPYVLDGAYGGINDLEGLRAECELSKRLGYDGRTLIHPSHIKVAREAYEPDPKEIDLYTRMVAAFEDAEKKGQAAITFENKLVDYAMYKKAKDFIDR
jgi:citrate lyase subunit beta/citryl-CoA lyase